MKILFIQGIHNFSLKERFVEAVSRATGYEVVYFPFDYGLFESDKHLELIEKVNTYIQLSTDRFVILGHSFGGILAYSLEEQSYAKIDKIITFATPHALPLFLLKKLTRTIPYRQEVPVPIQRSCGFYFDATVPFFFTRNAFARTHRNYLGTHVWVPRRELFFKNLIAE